MSKKCSTFASQMEKKQYIYPSVEVVAVNTRLMQSGLGGSDHPNYAPKRRTTEVF